MDAFSKAISVLTEVTVADAEQVIQNQQTATYFIGRRTCPYCRLFVEKLARVVEATGELVYFINREAPDQLAALTTFRQRYGIVTVPGFVRVSAGQVQVRCDSSMSEAEIEAMMTSSEN